MGSLPLLVINGAVGSGKSTILGEICEILSECGLSYTAVDLDALTQTSPTPPADPFNFQMGCANLTAIWANGRSQGARRLVVASVIESRQHLDLVVAAAPETVLFTCRLEAPVAELQRRVEKRELGSGQAWHAARAAELAQILDADPIDDAVVDTFDRPVRDIARDVLGAAGWNTEYR